jgi:hypothetical protein
MPLIPVRQDFRQKCVEPPDRNLHRSNKRGMDAVASGQKGTNLGLFKDVEVQFFLATAKGAVKPPPGVIPSKRVLHLLKHIEIRLKR